MRIVKHAHVRLAFPLLVCCQSAFSLNPSFDVNQYSHTAWKIGDGFAKGVIRSIVQTPDGYLWLGTPFGLFRFDGIRPVPWAPPSGEQLPSNEIRKLLVSREGTLWIGTSKGLASWNQGKFKRYSELQETLVDALLQDHSGTVWISGRAVPKGRLCAIDKDSVKCYGEDGSFGNGVYVLHEYKDRLWAVVPNRILCWSPTGQQTFSVPDLESNDLIEGDDGTLWIASARGMLKLVEGKLSTIAFPAARQVVATKFLRDREGSLWIGTSTQGLLHKHHGRIDTFASADGLSEGRIYCLFEDREGNIWVATSEGLDRFRDFAVPTFSSRQRWFGGTVSSVLAARDGGFWVGTGEGLTRWQEGQVTTYRSRPAGSTRHAEQPPARILYDSVLPDNTVESIFEDDRGRIWVSTLRGLVYLENGRFSPITKDAKRVRSITAGESGTIWINDQDFGLYRWSSGRLEAPIPWTKLGHTDFATAVVSHPGQGGLWLGFFQGGVAHFENGEIQESYSVREGFAEGRVNRLRFDQEGNLWAASEGGLSRLKHGRIATLTTRNGLPCDAVEWSMEGDARSLWLRMPCGLVRIARPEIDAWEDNPGRLVKLTLFDHSDGVKAHAMTTGYSPQVSKSADGRLWFVTGAGIGVVDPLHLPANNVAPPVQIEAVKINGKDATMSEGLALSPGANDLEIDYTALSLTIPERVRFRTKLEGKDKDWQDVGTRRQAYFGNLAPRQYRFRVMACNNDGVWNEAGAAWNFSIAPAYYQTIWFQALCVIAAGGLTWVLYRLRLRQMSARINLLYNERLAERTRIARDLHDGLLQSLAGVSLQLHGISKTAATAPEKTSSQIDRIRQQVDAAFREARTKVYNLRSPALEGQGLTEALSDFTERLGPTSTARCVLHVTGEPLACIPEIEEELLHIAQEAANNANRHAGAKEIRIAVEYSERSLKLSIADDGCGFHLEDGLAKTGHWGLKNMQDRAAHLRGRCRITSAPGNGTQVEVHVPLRRWSLRKNLAKRADSSSGGR